MTDTPQPYKLNGIGLMAKLGYKWAIDYPGGGTGYATTKRKALALLAETSPASLPFARPEPTSRNLDPLEGVPCRSN